MADSIDNATVGDLFHQSFSIVGPDDMGIVIGLDEVSLYKDYAVKISTSYGAQCGTCIVILVILLILTNPERRRMPVFILNALSLVINIARTIIQVLYFTGTFYDPYAYFSADFSRVSRGAYASSVTGDILVILLLVCIETSLLLQVHTIMVTANKIWKFWTMVLTGSIALMTIAMRIALSAVNIRVTLSLMAPSDPLRRSLAEASYATSMASIGFFSAVFCAKLAYALVQRRKLGLKQFGPMQIIFIMACQSMLIPLLFTGLQFGQWFPILSQLVYTITIIFLPLSAIWSAAAIDNRSQAASGFHADGPRKLLRTYNTASHDQKSAYSDGKMDTTGTASYYYDDDAVSKKWSRKEKHLETGEGSTRNNKIGLAA